MLVLQQRESTFNRAEEAWRVTQQRRKLLACVWCDVRSNCAESSSSFVPKGRRRQHLRVSPKNLGSYFMFGGRVGARDGGREGGSEGGMEGGREESNNRLFSRQARSTDEEIVTRSLTSETEVPSHCIARDRNLRYKCAHDDMTRRSYAILSMSSLNLLRPRHCKLKFSSFSSAFTKCLSS